MSNLIPLIDADILRYEVGYAAETGWKAITEERETIPPFDYVAKILNERIASICKSVGTTATPRLFLTEGKTFRYDLAKTKPYKGTRTVKKPWHYENISVYMRDVLGAETVRVIEADDKLAITHVSSKETTIICSRDKDLRQVPGWFFSWELGRQPSFGPIYIDTLGTISLSDDHKSIKATGLYSFYAQVLTGDKVDNIPGLLGCGPVAAYDILTCEPEQNKYNDPSDQSLIDRVVCAYREYYLHVENPDDILDIWAERLLEQGRLVWMTRKLYLDGSPVLWELGVEE